MCDTIILFEDKEFLISQCSTCKKICLYYHQVILAFKETEFHQWHTSFFTSKFEDRAYRFPDKEIKAILDTPYSDVQLSFNKQQYLELKNGVEQAINFMEIMDIID
ncbi:DUF6686 family protein [Psychroflexus tropicus]|uniref:DUF6686 family protein n=1 Tax=Psychroflexus tropicus TaxID=197345 RepID=UPI000363A993|nr:DUF6686 family protein [Psychroflexus tropicus]